MYTTSMVFNFCIFALVLVGLVILISSTCNAPKPTINKKILQLLKPEWSTRTLRITRNLQKLFGNPYEADSKAGGYASWANLNGTFWTRVTISDNDSVTATVTYNIPMGMVEDVLSVSPNNAAYDSANEELTISDKNIHRIMIRLHAMLQYAHDAMTVDDAKKFIADIFATKSISTSEYDQIVNEVARVLLNPE